MRFEFIKLRGIGPFVNEVSVDLTSIPGPLVAVTGSNGAGKSTLLELCAGAMYRATPTRGKLTALATTRDAFVEVRAVNGHAWTLRQTVDAVSGKGESLVLDAVGASVLDDTKVTTFDRWAATHLPSPEVLYASMFAAQGSGGFLDLSAADRKGVLLRALGIEHLEGLAEKAREHQRTARAELATVTARLADERKRGGDVAEADVALAQAKALVIEAGEALTFARADLAAAKHHAAAMLEAHRNREARLAERNALAQRVEAANGKLRGLAQRHADAVAMLDQEAEIRDAVAEMERLTAIAADLRAQHVRADAATGEASGRQRAAFDRQAEARKRVDAAMGRALARRHELETEVAGIEDKVARTTARIEKNRAELLDQADAIRDAVAEHAELTSKSHKLALDLERNAGELAQAGASMKRIVNDGVTAEKRRDDAGARVVKLTDQLKIEDAVMGAVTDLASAKADLAKAEADVAAAEADLEEMRASRGAGADARIEALRSAHERIRAGKGSPAAVSSAALDMDDHQAELAASAPEREREAWSARAKALECRASATAAVARLERLAARADEMVAARADLTRAEADLAAEVEALTQLRIEAAQVKDRAMELRGVDDRTRAANDNVASELERLRPLAAKAKDLAGAEERVDGYQREIDADRIRLDDVRAKMASLPEDGGPEAVAANLDVRREMGLYAKAGDDVTAALKHEEDLLAAKTENAAAIAHIRPLAAKAEDLAKARALADELADQVAAAQANADALAEQLAALPAIPAEVPVPDFTSHERAVEAAEQADREAAGAVAVAESKLAAANEASGRIAALAEQQREVEEALSDWTRLADDLGKDGLQAAEIDCAGPELTELVNDLLHTCVGARWTVSIETQRASSDGKKTIEGCDVRVLDTERGRDANAETLSGGERVQIGEAISLALSMLACRRSGVEGPTLFRDESGAALDPVNGRAYVAMLRRAAVIVGASKVLFISHTPELQELADGRIHVADGKVEVMS